MENEIFITLHLFVSRRIILLSTGLLITLSGVIRRTNLTLRALFFTSLFFMEFIIDNNAKQ